MHWLGDKPVLVSGVTDGWAALSNWKKREMLQRYPNAEATMGEAKLLGETGPDGAGKNLSPTTVKDFITKHMYDPLKYFFDRKIAIPKGMLVDCYPFPCRASIISSRNFCSRTRRSYATFSVKWDHLSPRKYLRSTCTVIIIIVTTVVESITIVGIAP